MSRMSEQHDDLATIHAILLGQRKVAQDLVNGPRPAIALVVRLRVEVINDLLTEIEAAGVVWPGNVVDISHG